MAARSRGNGTNFDWLRKSHDTSACDLSPDGNPEKYGRLMKSAIALFKTFLSLANSLLRVLQSAAWLDALANRIYT